MSICHNFAAFRNKFLKLVQPTWTAAGTVKQMRTSLSLSQASGCKKDAPLGESGGAIDFEALSAGEATLLVEMVEDRGVNLCEPL
jgi:hypothetical protein